MGRGRGKFRVLRYEWLCFWDRGALLREHSFGFDSYFRIFIKSGGEEDVRQ